VSAYFVLRFGVLPIKFLMRILQLNSARKYIGEAAHTLNLTEALRLRGHQVWLGLRKGYETIERATVRSLDPVPFNMPHRWWPPQDGPDIRHIARLTREHKIDLIHAHRGKDHWQAVLAVRFYRLGVPVVRTRHVVTPLSANLANRWLARRTGALVAVSRAVAQDVRGTGIYPEVALIPGGIDLKLFAPAEADRRSLARRELGLPDQALVAVCVARFAVVKAHAVLLEAWRRVLTSHPDARLVLVGGGLLQEESQALAEKLGIAARVCFAGKRHDVPALLDAADIGVLSSIGSEGFSRAVLEYMAKGLPSVATTVGAVPDLIEDGRHGLLAAPNDPAALAARLVEALAAGAEKRAEWGRAARQKAEAGHSFASWAQAHEALYARVCQDTGGD
jgi:glycosyltransferase involved in cell wall biosynthesis